MDQRLREWFFRRGQSDAGGPLTFALQALLVRHEAYMAEAEQSRQEMSHRIGSLEIDKKNLEAENAREIQENRKLLDELEELNSSLADSENHIKSLEATLQSTQQELHRLEGFAQRTQDLEVQIAVLEQEQAIIQRTLVTSEAEEREAIQRWRKAEQALIEVQEQLEKIEREAMEERKRHVEVMGRMERQRVVEKELESAAGRLKGAAAATSLGQGRKGSNVVSHFVKDILQDNANLQLGIVELREMLMNSNEEVQSLREQLMLHQPLHDGNSHGDGPPTLKAELAPNESHTVPQELHIHHHYHAQVKREEIRRPKKKRNVINPALFTPPGSLHSSMSSRSVTMRPTPSTTVAILSQTSTTVPRPMTPTNRWSIQSMQTLSDLSSSAPSSPQSVFRNSVIFDRGNIDQPFDSSQPTSPGSSVGPLSPISQPLHLKRSSELSSRHTSLNTAFHPDDVIHEESDNDIGGMFPDLASAGPAPNLQIASVEESTHVEENEELSPPPDPKEPSRAENPFSNFTFQPSFRRSVSHESILSIAGLDIHTLKSRPSQATMSPMLRPGTRLGCNNNQPVISSSSIVAYPILSRYGHDSSAYLRSSMGISERPISRSSNGSDEGQTLGKMLGGWVWGRWGVAPTPSPPRKGEGMERTPNTPNAWKRTVSSPVSDPMRPFTGRASRINQEGPIPCLGKPGKAPSKVIPDRIDQTALGEVLTE
jgi:hypothetical protein